MRRIDPAPKVPRAAGFAAASGAEPAKMRRVAQDCDPTAYMYTTSGRMDARIGHFSRASTVAAKPAVTLTRQAGKAVAKSHPAGGDALAPLLRKLELAH